MTEGGDDQEQPKQRSLPKVQFEMLTVTNENSEKNQLVVKFKKTINIYNMKESGPDLLCKADVPVECSSISSFGDKLIFSCNQNVRVVKVVLGEEGTEEKAWTVEGNVKYLSSITANSVLVSTSTAVSLYNFGEPNTEPSKEFNIKVENQAIQASEIIGDQVFILTETGHLYSSEVHAGLETSINKMTHVELGTRVSEQRI